MHITQYDGSIWVIIMPTESPDLPWTKNHDTLIKQPIAGSPSEAAKSLLAFLAKAGIKSGRIAVCTSEPDAVLFAEAGFEVHHVSETSDIFEDLEPYGIRSHCFNLADYWLFEDGFFDFLLCDVYHKQMARVIKKGGILSSKEFTLPGAEAPESVRRSLPEGFDSVSMPEGILRLS